MHIYVVTPLIDGIDSMGEGVRGSDEGGGESGGI